MGLLVEGFHHVPLFRYDQRAEAQSLILGRIYDKFKVS